MANLYFVTVCYRRGFSRCGWFVQADNEEQAEKKVAEIFPLNDGDEFSALLYGTGCIYDNEVSRKPVQVRPTKSPDIMREWYECGRL